MTKDEFFTNWNTSKTWMIAINNKPMMGSVRRGMLLDAIDYRITKMKKNSQ